MAPSAPSSRVPGRGDDGCSSKPTLARPSRRGPPTDSAGTLVDSSAQAMPPAAPSSLLCLLPGLSVMRMRPLLPPGVAPFATNDIQPGAANARSPTDPSAANDCQPGAANPWRPAVLVELFALVSFRGRTPHVCEERNPAPPLPTPSMALNGLRQQFLLAIPLMAAMHKIFHVWSLLGCWAAFSYVKTASARGASIFRILSNRIAVGGVTARLFSYIDRWFGFEGRPFSRFADFVDHVSIFFRHTCSALTSATDILNKVNEFQSINATQPHIPQESAPSTNESNKATSQETMGIIVDNTESHDGQPGLEQKIVRSISEGNEVISQWKEENSQFSVDVPPDMSPQTAKTLKQNFEKEGASHLIQGTTINSILEKALVSAKSEFDRAFKEVEDLQQLLHPSSSSGGKMDQ